MLVVNTATECGYTPQFEGLEALYRERRGDGFVVLGFPANDFAGQEPRSNDEIAEFCEANYGVTFPMFAKTVVTGRARTRCSGGSVPRRARRSGTSTSTSSTGAGRSWRGSGRAPSRTARSWRSGSTRCCDSVRTRTYVLVYGRTNLTARAGRHRRASGGGVADRAAAHQRLRPASATARTPTSSRDLDDRLVRVQVKTSTVASRTAATRCRSPREAATRAGADSSSASARRAATTSSCSSPMGGSGSSLRARSRAARRSSSEARSTPRTRSSRGRPFERAASGLIARLRGPRRGSGAVKRASAVNRVALPSQVRILPPPLRFRRRRSRRSRRRRRRRLAADAPT